MSKIRGRCAGSGWLLRSEACRLRILSQLKALVQQLRTISPPDGVAVASVHGGPVYEPRLPSDPLLGPFITIQDFHQKLLDNWDLNRHFNSPFDDLNELLEFYRGFNEKPVFTHGDLSSLNVLVEGDEVTGTVDWETAGWLPSYWEYTSAWFVNPQNPFWQLEVDLFLTPMPHELKMDTIRRKYYSPFE